MPAYNLSSFAGAGAQFFDSNGDPLAGGKLYTYVAGTTTPKATYTTSTGAVANANPIILDAAGRTPNEIWLEVGVQYKFILKTSADVTIGTYDNLPPINDPYSINSLLSNVTGTNTIAATATPTLTAYAAGQTYSFVAANSNTAAATLSIDGLTAKSITKNGLAALSAGDIQAGKLTWVEYDGTTFQLINNYVYNGSVFGSTMTDVTIVNGTVTSMATPIPVAAGGTGAATLTSKSVLIGNGTSAVTGVAPGNASNILISDGTDWTSAANRAVPTVTGNAGRLLFTDGTTASWSSDSTVRARASILTPNGTPAFQTGAVNSATVSRSGVGTFPVAFTNALTSANYQVVITLSELGVVGWADPATVATTGFTIKTYNTASGLASTPTTPIMFVVYGGF
jgi:hypothetical protein